MEAIKTTARIHPLMAAAAVSVIVVSLAGTAAITGLLPNSRGANETPVAAAQLAPALPLAAAGVAPQAVQPAGYVQPAAYAQPAGYAQPVVANVQPAPAPVIIKETVIKEVPVKTAPKPRPAYHQPTYVRNDAPVYAEPRPAAQPNYVAIGTGAVVGGLLGNQVGSGNGRKLATIAGVIGGGMLGNQIANQNR
ncbi:glycine zipper 2TM domain-containing protein [Massilia sp. TN1-12]|uniref:glycine zipper 2TM domain-containing protein n=1 Tax=Massilia paldalensis TaxID=3377675 RepID=UPI00384AE708